MSITNGATVVRSDGAVKAFKSVDCDRKEVSLGRGSIRTLMHMALRARRHSGSFMIGRTVTMTLVSRTRRRKRCTGIFKIFELE